MITVVGAVEYVRRVTGGPPRWAYNKNSYEHQGAPTPDAGHPHNLAPPLTPLSCQMSKPGRVITTDIRAMSISPGSDTHDPKTVGLMEAHVVLPCVHGLHADKAVGGARRSTTALRRKARKDYIENYCLQFNAAMAGRRLL